MECNKDDAIKAKVISEQKLTVNDFSGAKKFALKAQALYPGLENLTQLIMTIDVYVSAEQKVNGEVDWYQVLGVATTADDETIRKQYRKLALMLHPDKNKCVGADGAFKLVSEAWSLLSDNSKRLAYNRRRSSNRLKSSTGTSSNNVSRVNPTFPPRPSIPKNKSFWTKCEGCSTYFEYLNMYKNQTLRCTRCRQSFKAIETAPPSSYSKPPNSTPHQTHQNPAPIPENPNPFPHKSNHMPPHHANVSNLATAPNTVSSPSVVVKAANVVQKANENMKRAREEAQGTHGLDKKRGLNGNFNGFVGNKWPQMSTGSKVDEFFGVKCVDMSTRELNAIETRKMLIKKAKTEIIERLSQFSTEDSTKVNASDVKQKRLVKAEKGKVNKKGEKAKRSTKTSTDEEINVPDSDFYDFDQDRNESSFGENQVWAGYDDDDGMPRLYALVHKVISTKPFKMRISWLGSKTNAEFSNMNWVGSGFYKTCGEFTVGKPKFTNSLNSFSHKVEWVKGPTGSICIYPKKGQIWALYRNWSLDWNEFIPDDVVHKYNMVEVQEDYNEDKGVSIALIKVSGFRTVFCRVSGSVKIIPKEEMLRFSHQVPNHLLTGEEAEKAPKGLQELDPASTSFELIQVNTEDVLVENQNKLYELMTE